MGEVLQLVQPQEELRRCKKCDDEKALSLFPSTGKWHRWTCKQCASKAQGPRTRAYRKKHPEKAAQISREGALRYFYNLKAQVFAKHGNRCNNPQCTTPGGCTDIRCLHLDHVNNDGYVSNRRTASGARTRARTTVYKQALKDTEGRFQLLCANCNSIKAWETNQLRLQAEARRT